LFLLCVTAFVTKFFVNDKEKSMHKGRNHLVACQSNLRSLAKRLEFHKELQRTGYYPQSLAKLLKANEDLGQGIFVCPAGQVRYEYSLAAGSQNYTIFCRGQHQAELDVLSNPYYSSNEGPVFLPY
jgi:hypothetical protein